jgi:arsenite-transporting ATPase
VRLVLYTGKGGVGKTTSAAATAVCAAERGRRTLVASADAAHSLGDVLERRLGAAPVELAPRLHALEIDARSELERHWGSIRSFLVSLFVHQGMEAIVAEELALLPGAEELTTLLAVEELAASHAYDLVVLDCAPTDAALRLVTLPDVAHGSLRVLLPLFEAISGIAVPLARRLLSAPLPDAGVFGEADELVNRRLRALQARMRDESTSVRLVVTPERMVIDEARRAWTELALFEVGCDAVVLNRRLPPEAADEAWFAERARLEDERHREVEALFAPHPVLVAPLQDDEVTGLARLSRLGAQLFRGVEPDAVLSSPERVRFERDDGGYTALLPLPGIDPAHVAVAKVEDELTVTAGSRRRSLVLPRRMAPLELAGARVDGSWLRVSLRAAPAEPRP